MPVATQIVQSNFKLLGERGAPFFITGAPVNGTNAVHTLTIGGTPTSGSFILNFGGFENTPPIAWSATDATLMANIANGLNILPTIGAGTVTVTAGTGSSGIGTYFITFGGVLANASIPAINVFSVNLAGTAPTVSVVTTTPGVTSSLRGCPPGTRIVDSTGPREYINAGTVYAPAWIRDGERIAVVPLTATSLTTGGAVASWTPAEGGPLIITRAYANITTKSTGAANISVGIAVNATTSSVTLMAATAVGTAAVLIDSQTTGVAAQLLPAGSFVTATGSATTVGLVGNLYIVYVKL